MKRVWCLGAMLTVAICGCAPKKEESPQPPAGNPSTPPVTKSTPPAKPDPIKEFTGQLPKPPSKMTPAAKATDSWAKSPSKAQEIARKVDDRLAKLKGVSGRTMTYVEMSGNHGQSMGDVAVDSSGRFRFDYVVLFQNPEPGLTRNTLIADGSRFSFETADQGWLPAKPVTAFASESDRALNQFAIQFPRTVYSAFAGGKPFQRLVQTATASGFEVLCEERLINDTRTGGMVGQYRLLISRPAAQAKSLGAMEIEAVFDKRLLLPVTIRTNQEPPKKDPLRLMWSMRWNLQPDQKFAKDAFTIPQRTASTSKRKV